jgi:hypothetical protein
MGYGTVIMHPMIETERSRLWLGLIPLFLVAGCSGQATEGCSPVPYPRASGQASGGAGACAQLVVLDDVSYALSAIALDMSVDGLDGAGMVDATNVSGLLVDGALYALPGVEVAQALATEVWRGGTPELVILWGPDADSGFPALCEYVPTRDECLAGIYMLERTPRHGAL